MTAKCFHYLWLPTIYIVHLGISTPTAPSDSLSLSIYRLSPAPSLCQRSLPSLWKKSRSLQLASSAGRAAVASIAATGQSRCASPTPTLSPFRTLSPSPAYYSSYSLPLHSFIIAVARRHQLRHRRNCNCEHQQNGPAEVSQHCSGSQDGFEIKMEHTPHKEPVQFCEMIFLNT